VLCVDASQIHPPTSRVPQLVHDSRPMHRRSTAPLRWESAIIANRIYPINRSVQATRVRGECDVSERFPAARWAVARPRPLRGGPWPPAHVYFLMLQASQAPQSSPASKSSKLHDSPCLPRLTLLSPAVRTLAPVNKPVSSPLQLLPNLLPAQLLPLCRHVAGCAPYVPFPCTTAT